MVARLCTNLLKRTHDRKATTFNRDKTSETSNTTDSLRSKNVNKVLTSEHNLKFLQTDTTGISHVSYIT
jgi:hypothetical protein